MPGAVSRSTSPSAVGSITASSVTTRSTRLMEVMGRELHESGIDQFTDADSGPRAVVGNDRQRAFLLPHDFVDEVMRTATSDESADHDRGAIGDLCHDI